MVTLLNERKPATESLSGTFLGSLIIDTDATNHMRGSNDFLSDIRELVPLLVKLPDGRITLATCQGIVALGSSLTIQDVLFVDGLQCHLISVSQLTRHKTCVFPDY